LCMRVRVRRCICVCLCVALVYPLRLSVTARPCGARALVAQTERELLRNEIAVLKLVRHASIVRLEAVFETNHMMYIVLEKVSGGELYNRIVGRQRFSEFEARALIKPLIEAVAFIHAMGIVHRDIKVCWLCCAVLPFVWCYHLGGS
jgi:serine/threonine protein kinase